MLELFFSELLSVILEESVCSSFASVKYIRIDACSQDRSDAGALFVQWTSSTQRPRPEGQNNPLRVSVSYVA
jgi:hypothetical protein